MNIYFMPYIQSAFTTFEYLASGVKDESGKIGGHRKNYHCIEFDKSKGITSISLWYDKTRKPLHKYAANRETQIFIRGHGDPGSPQIRGGRGGEFVTFETVGTRLLESGLDKKFPGQILCYSCHSAKCGKPGAKDTINGKEIVLDGRPFAKLLAEYMYSKGYVSCSFFGFFGQLDSLPKEPVLEEAVAKVTILSKNLVAPFNHFPPQSGIPIPSRPSKPPVKLKKGYYSTTKYGTGKQVWRREDVKCQFIPDSSSPFQNPLSTSTKVVGKIKL